MIFDQRTREIGGNEYNSGIRIVQSRSSGFVPAIGFGYRYDFSGGISVNTNITMGIFNGIPDPEIDINSGDVLASADEASLLEKMNGAYKDNFHNHYHIFNLGILYRFK